MFLPNLTEEERGFVVALVYRVGMSISHSDDVDTAHDDRLEVKALEKTLKNLAASGRIPHMTRLICQAVLDNHKHWEEWEQHTLTVLSDCDKALAILRTRRKKQELMDYKRLLLTVANAVAGAYDEYHEVPEKRGFLSFLIPKSQNKDTFLNISVSEDAAITNLKQALR